jgi:hypothetical protein
MAIDKKTYGKLYKEHYLEQYKIYINSIDKISDRRESANKYFVSVNSALIVLSGFIVQYANSKKDLLLIGVAGVGAVVAITFWILINSYKQLNTAKFSVLHLIEHNLPIELYKDEWDLLGKGKDAKKYFPFSHVERIIPVIFFISYIVIAIIVLAF